MSFRDDILAGVVDPLRYLPDTTFGLRTYEVRLVKRRWQAVGSFPARVGVGTYVDDKLVLQPRPKVREQSNGFFLVDKITPKNAAGGYEAVDLNPAPEAGVEFFWELEGPFASGRTESRFRVVSIDASKPFTYTVLLENLDRTKPT
jgi:hypothetical protein